MKKINIYTDGACSGNPGRGGWAAILHEETKQSVLKGSEEFTTNNRMEMIAAIAALESLLEPCDVVIFTDSKYLCDGFAKYLSNWIKNNWRTASKSEVKNIDLWKRIITMQQKHHIKMEWIKGHSGNQYNDMADKIAVEMTKI